MSVLRREAEWYFDLTPEELWPIVSHTARVNEAAGFPSYQLQETARADGTVERRGSVRVAGITVEWEECPFQWVHNREFHQKRLFTSGPIRSGTIDFHLDEEGEGTKVRIVLTVDAANAIGVIAGRVLMHRFSRTFERLTRQAAEYLGGKRTTLYDYKPPTPNATSRDRVEVAVARLEAGPYAHNLAQRLADYVTGEQDVAVERIRPLELARLWEAPSRHVIELCLAAVDAGLLAMRWQLLCPSCRGGKEAVSALDQLPSGAHCPSCNIDYARDFARNVELVFYPSATIRQVPLGGYCLSGPATTPHVMVQQTIEPGEERRVAVRLSPGPYRARALSGSESDEFEVDEDRVLPQVEASDGKVEAKAGDVGRLIFVNRRNHAISLVVESRDWVADALTAHQVTTLQAFRDLFAQAALRPGDEAAVDRVTLLFTDLKGSTALYERVGDAAAYNLVRDHFSYLTRIVRENDGALIKTIGDAVMAAFAEPADAVRAAITIQQQIDGFNAAHRSDNDEVDPVVIKLGVHEGPCVVVTLNGEIDYFGSTANLAARLQGQSRGGDLVLSEEIAKDPAVAALVANMPLVRESAPLRGFAKPIAFRRMSFDGARKAA
ncbi:MAG: adenylate/guanylate cyclase domain-containing protein [Salaquimonas sp.]|nr:adenylate/guanylate cyclase domain-containing protein [Salaquimonas sp.]